MNSKRAVFNSTLFQNFSFWRKFSRLLLIGSSALVLLFVSQTAAIRDIQIALANQDTPANLGATCDNGTANFHWDQAIRPAGEPAFNYTLRVNKEPYDVWSPDDGVSGDKTFQVGSGINYTTALDAGNYGFSVQAGYQSDMQTTATVDGPTFNCAGTPAATAAPTSAPTAAPASGPADVVTAPSGGVASCAVGGAATFNWSPASKTNQTVTNYTVRVNKDPGADWSPGSGSGDEAWETNSAGTNASRQLTTGNYADWTIQAGFSDGTTSEAAHFGAFVCAASGGTPPSSGIGAHIAGGDFMQAFNNTTQEGGWRDPVSAAPGNVIEYVVAVVNDGDAPTGNIQVWGSTNGLVSQDPGLQHTITSKIHNPNTGQSVTDTATVTVTGGMPVGMREFPGHARIRGVTDIYNCANNCTLSDAVMTGINIGVIQPGQMVEVTFKAVLVNAPVPTAAPTSGPAAPGQGATTTTIAVGVGTAVATNTTNVGIGGSGPLAVATATATGGAGGAGGSSTTNNTYNITNNNTSPAASILLARNGNVGAGTSGGVRVLAVSQLPKTGLPALAWTALAFVPAGFRLRRFSKVTKDLENHPSFIHEDRQFKRA